MDLAFEPIIENTTVMEYTKKLEHSKSLCMVCLTDETEDGQQWDRYQLKCGHIAHTRCLRRWCGVKKCVNCPVCGDVPQLKRNRFCSDCNKFGHSVMMDRCARRKVELDAFLHEFGLAFA